MNIEEESIFRRSRARAHAAQAALACRSARVHPTQLDSADLNQGQACTEVFRIARINVHRCQRLASKFVPALDPQRWRDTCRAKALVRKIGHLFVPAPQPSLAPIPSSRTQTPRCNSGRGAGFAARCAHSTIYVQNRCEAILAPSVKALILAHATWGCDRARNPQSVPAMTFSRRQPWQTE